MICEKEESSVPNMHVVTPGGIAYQTVLAKVNFKGKPSITCRCLLDTGCDKTYMLQKTANLLKSKPLTQDKKVLDTVHGCMEKGNTSFIHFIFILTFLSMVIHSDTLFYREPCKYKT